MSTVDEILASGRYADRRGRGWDYVETVAAWCSPEIDAEGVSWGYRYLDTAQMRLLIERDKHRDECKGLIDCSRHPVPTVVVSIWGPGTPPPDWSLTFEAGLGDGQAGEVYDTLLEAMDAARALAAGQ